MNKVNVVVGQSGGPTAVINSSLYGVIKESFNNTDRIDKVYGMVNGIQGFIEDRYIDIRKEMSDEEIELLKTTPAAYLGSCRYKLPEEFSDSIYPAIFKKFSDLGIGYFIYIGGNDSMDTVHKLSVYAKKTNSSVRIIGIPKTIDNDLTHTDHSPGYGSAAKYVAATVRDIVMDASVYNAESVTIVELMGRHAGWITAASILARKFENDNPALIYLPENEFCLDEFVESVKKEVEKRNTVVVCVSEGIKDKEGKFICEYASESGTDNFGHKMLTGCGKYLENVVKDRLGIKVRSVELNVNQRCKEMLSSLTDINEAVMAGEFGVKACLDGQTGMMVSFKREDKNGYRIDCELTDCADVCNQEKEVPTDWILDSGKGVTQDFVEYVKPLIQGENIPVMEGGLPKYCYRK
ncbi:MAG: 6-phosphofructokinase [Lachnospiraceae bacterium]|nr:6-phosphofructokinase [Lachnospiraceae bacterium]